MDIQTLKLYIIMYIYSTGNYFDTQLINLSTF